MTLKDKYYGDGKTELCKVARLINNDYGSRINAGLLQQFIDGKSKSIQNGDKSEINFANSESVNFGNARSYFDQKHTLANNILNQGMDQYRLMGGISPELKAKIRQEIEEVLGDFTKMIEEFQEDIKRGYAEKICMADATNDRVGINREFISIGDVVGLIDNTISGSSSGAIGQEDNGHLAGVGTASGSTDPSAVLFGRRDNQRLNDLLSLFVKINSLYDYLEMNVSKLWGILNTNYKPVTDLSLAENGYSATVFSNPDDANSPNAKLYMRPSTSNKNDFSATASLLTKPRAVMAAHKNYTSSTNNISGVDNAHIITMPDSILAHLYKEFQGGTLETASSYIMLNNTRPAQILMGVRNNVYLGSSNEMYELSSEPQGCYNSESNLDLHPRLIRVLSPEIRLAAVNTNFGFEQPTSYALINECGIRFTTKDKAQENTSNFLLSPNNVVITRNSDTVLYAADNGVFINDNLFVKGNVNNNFSGFQDLFNMNSDYLVNRYKYFREDIEERLKIIKLDNCCSDSHSHSSSAVLGSSSAMPGAPSSDTLPPANNNDSQQQDPSDNFFGADTDSEGYEDSEGDENPSFNDFAHSFRASVTDPIHRSILDDIIDVNSGNIEFQRFADAFPPLDLDDIDLFYSAVENAKGG